MSTESFQQYDNLPNENELVNHYKPKFLARGGDHLVFEIVKHPNIVIKASTFTVKDILSDNADNHLPLDSFSGDIKDRIEKEIADKNEQVKLLQKYFGKEHTLSERRYLMKVPITKDIIEEIYKNDWQNRQPPVGYENIQECWSSVIVQGRADGINDPNHRGFFFGGFLEEREYDDDEYKKLNESLIMRDSQSQESTERFLTLQDNPETHALRDAISLAASDSEFRQILEEMILKIMRYAQETGNILALSGRDNIIFYKTPDDKWEYLLVDALPIHNEPVFNDAKAIIHRFTNGEEITKHEKTLLMKALNFTRTINGMCASLGLDNRLDLIPDEDKGKNIDFSLVLRQ